MEPSLRALLNKPEFRKAVPYQLRQCPAGAVLLQEDSMGSELGLVLEGVVEIVVRVDHLGSPGRVVTIARLFENEIFGELSLLDTQPRTASVVAAGPCSVALIDGAALIRFLDAHPADGYWILKDCFHQLAKRMRESTLRRNALFGFFLDASKN